MNEQSVISAIESELQAQGFDLNKAPKAKEFVSIIVNNVLAEVRKGTINVPGTGLAAPSGGGPVTGSATGNIS
jgi:hypothetical protein